MLILRTSDLSYALRVAEILESDGHSTEVDALATELFGVFIVFHRDNYA